MGASEWVAGVGASGWVAGVGAADGWRVWGPADGWRVWGQWMGGGCGGQRMGGGCGGQRMGGGEVLLGGKSPGSAWNFRQRKGNWVQGKARNQDIVGLSHTDSTFLKIEIEPLYVPFSFFFLNIHIYCIFLFFFCVFCLCGFSFSLIYSVNSIFKPMTLHLQLPRKPCQCYISQGLCGHRHKKNCILYILVDKKITYLPTKF